MESLDSLREILCCTASTYQSYKRFNNLILQKIHKELLEKTECRYTYSAVKKGRKVVAVKFQMICSIQVEEPKVVFELEIPKENRNIDDIESELWEIAVKQYHFSREQLEEIRTYLMTVPEHFLPQDNVIYQNDIMIRLHGYLSQKVAAMERRSASKPIKNKFAYLISMIREDVFQ